MKTVCNCWFSVDWLDKLFCSPLVGASDMKMQKLDKKGFLKEPNDQSKVTLLRNAAVKNTVKKMHV